MDVQIRHFELEPLSNRWLADGQAEALGESIHWQAWRDSCDRHWTVELPRPTGLPMDLLELLLEHLCLFDTVRGALTDVECQGGLPIAA